MKDPLQPYIRELANTDAMWVERRDAADRLGAIAGKALDALRDFARDSDTDVRMAVNRALKTGRAGLEGIAPGDGITYSMDDFAREIERPPKRFVEFKGKGLEVTVNLKDDRKQLIIIEPYQPPSGMELVRVYTRCGKPQPDSYVWALESNMSMAQCALALTRENGEEMYWLVNNFLADHLTPAEIKTAVKEISYYGDWIEKKMTGQDEF